MTVIPMVTGCSSEGPQAPAEVDALMARCMQSFGDPAMSPYVLPFGAGRSYRLIQGYCPPDPTWGHHGWLAYDFDMQIGDTILAARSGTVRFERDGFADGTRVCGEENIVFVEHVDGTVMQYVHLTRGGSLVEAGEAVVQGQPIGLSGDSGCSSGPHLHINLFRNRSNYDEENSIPLNFSNADGPHDARGGLVQGALYTATGS